MIKLILNPSKYSIQEIFKDPKLLEVHSGHTGYQLDYWEPAVDTQYIIGIDLTTGRQIGMVTFKPYTNRILETHIYTLPSYWGTGLSKNLAMKVYTDIFIPSQYTKLMTYTPAKCVQVINFLENFGFRRVGTFTHGLEYLGDITDLYIYEHEKLLENN